MSAAGRRRIYTPLVFPTWGTKSEMWWMKKPRCTFTSSFLSFLFPPLFPSSSRHQSHIVQTCVNDITMYIILKLACRLAAESWKSREKGLFPSMQRPGNFGRGKRLGSRCRGVDSRASAKRIKPHTLCPVFRRVWRSACIKSRRKIHPSVRKNIKMISFFPLSLSSARATSTFFKQFYHPRFSFGFCLALRRNTHRHSDNA